MEHKPHTLEEEVQRGHAAALLRENEIFVEVIDGVKQDLFVQWTETDRSQPEVREEIFRLYKTAEAIEDRITEIIEGGRMAADMIEAERKKDNLDG